MKIPFIGQAYQNRSIPVANQRCINWYPELEPGDARNVITLQAVSGSVEFLNTYVNSGVRGLYYSESLSKAYFVIKNTAYESGSNGSYNSIGSIAGTALVAMADNGTQIAFASGEAGYIYSSADGMEKVADLGPVKDVVQQDGYFLFVKTDGSQFNLTALFDGTVIDPLDFAAATNLPDPIISIEQANDRVWLLGSNGGETWQNTGAADFPFGKTTGASYNGYGCAGTFASVVADSSVYFCSNDGRIYMINGYTPQRISHYGVENSLRKYSTLEDCEASAWTENGHRFIAFSFPTGGETWVFDSTTSMWHQRSSGVSGAIWDGRFSIKAWNKRIVGHRTSGKLATLDLDTFTEYGNAMMARRTSPTLHSNQNVVFVGRLELVFETGTVATSDNPQARLSWSDNGGVTFGNSVFRSIGKIGEYAQKAVWHRLGQSKNRVFDLQITDTAPRTLIDAIIEGEQGNV